MEKSQDALPSEVEIQVKAGECVGAMQEPGKVYTIPEGKTLEECWAQAGYKMEAIRGEKVEQEPRAGEMDRLRAEYHRNMDPLWVLPPVPVRLVGREAREAFVGLGLGRIEKEREWEKAMGFYGVAPAASKWVRVYRRAKEYLQTVWRALCGGRVEEWED